VNVYWYPDPSAADIAEFESWRAARDGSAVAALAIGRTTIVAFGTNDTNQGWATVELRRYHTDLSSALTAVLARLGDAPSGH
jgi:hypothetical protein